MDAVFRERMQKIADAQAESPKSPAIGPEKYEAITRHLQLPEVKVDPHFKHWVKTRRFQLVYLPGLQVLVIPASDHKDTGGTSGSKLLRVIHAGDICDVVWRVHSEGLRHSGYKKVLEYIQRNYFGVTRGFVQEFCKQCPMCQHTQPRTFRAPSRPSEESNFLDRVQFDIIDMRHSPDGDYNFIGHFVDHFSNFHILFPLRGKTAEEVARLLEERVLAYLGPPSSFHSDNRLELANQLIQKTCELWGGNTMFVTGRPDHSQSQEVEECGNSVVEMKISAMKLDQGITGDSCPWSTWLPRVMFSMNSEYQETIKDSPYRVVFGRQSPAGGVPGSTLHDSSGSTLHDSSDDVKPDVYSDRDEQDLPVVDSPTSTSPGQDRCEKPSITETQDAQSESSIEVQSEPPLTPEFQPASTQPTSTQPASSQPASSQPASTQPASSQPASTQPASSQPASTQPASSQPASSQPASTQPASSQPASSQPASTQPCPSPTADPSEPESPTCSHTAAFKRTCDSYDNSDNDTASRSDFYMEKRIKIEAISSG